MLNAYSSFEVDRSEDKETRFESCFTAWGSEVNGRGGHVSVNVDKRRQIARLTHAVVRRGSSTKPILQSLLGSIVHPFLHARHLMCCLSSVYKFLVSMPEDAETRLPAAVLDELMIASLWLACAHTNIRAPVSSTISATDATCIRGGRCRATVPGKLARALYRRGEARGEHGYLKWTDIECDELPTKMQRPNLELDELVTALPWRQAKGYDFVGAHHINIQELRAVVDEVEARLYEGSKSVRLVNCIDSRVCTGAIAKGRSSSTSLNTYLRRLTTRCLAGDIQLKVCWVSTSANPADAPSRHANLPARALLPSWARTLFDEAPRQSEMSGYACNADTVCPQASAAIADPVVRKRKHNDGKHSCAGISHAQEGKASREYYSGSGQSSSLRRHKRDTLEVDAYRTGCYDETQDLGDRRVVDREIEDIRAGRVEFAHIAIVCSSWSRMCVTYNNGSRSKKKPYGEKVLKREITGNLQLEQAWRLIKVLTECHVPWTLENPIDSYIWQTVEMRRAQQIPGCEEAVFDQCMYKLRPPDWKMLKDDVRVRKRTRIIGTLPGLSSLSKRCDGNRVHAQAMGHCRVGGKRISRAKAAGAYPVLLCNCIARLVASAVTIP